MGGKCQRSAEKAHHDTVLFIQLGFGDSCGFKNHRPPSGFLGGHFQTGFRGCLGGTGVIGNGWNIVGPPFQITSNGVGFHRKIEKKGNTIGLVTLGRIHNPFCQEIRIFEHFLCRFIDHKSTMNSCIRYPRGFRCPFAPIGIDQHLFGHGAFPFLVLTVSASGTKQIFLPPSPPFHMAHPQARRWCVHSPYFQMQAFALTETSGKDRMLFQKHNRIIIVCFILIHSNARGNSQLFQSSDHID